MVIPKKNFLWNLQKELHKFLDISEFYHQFQK